MYVGSLGCSPYFLMRTSLHVLGQTSETCALWLLWNSEVSLRTDEKQSKIRTFIGKMLFDVVKEVKSSVAALDGGLKSLSLNLNERVETIQRQTTVLVQESALDNGTVKTGPLLRVFFEKSIGF